MIIQTKRFLYNVFIKTICNKTGCFSVTGARKVGKTVLLMQLNEYFAETSDYFDCTELIANKDFDFETYYQKLLDEGKKIVLLDEICKIDDYYLADFIKYTKLYSAKMCIIITGSVAAIVKKRVNEIGRGSNYQLPPFMYIERLCWNNGYNEINVNAIKELTSDEYFKEYLKTQMMSQRELLGYIKGVVEDTITSYKERTFLEDIEEIDDVTLIDALKYISLCQFVYKKRNGEYVDIPSLEKNIREIVLHDYTIAKVKWGLRTKDIDNVVKLLLGCNLAQKVTYYRGDLVKIEKISIAEQKIPEIVFEYPWYCSLCFSKEIQNSDSMIKLWVEFTLLIKALYVYQYVNKYRANDEEEIDILYSTGDRYYGIEVKDKPYENNNRKYINKVKQTADEIGLQDYIISSSQGTYSNDKFVASLELEYIDLLEKDNLYSGNNITELLTKYGFEKD